MVKKVWIVALTLVACANNGGCNSTETDTEDTDPTTDTDTGPPCPSSGVTTDRVDCIVALEGDLAAGATFYDNNCQLCHLDDGSGDDTVGAADLTLSSLTEPNIVITVLQGLDYTTMDAYDDYQNQQLADVTTYVNETFVNP